MSSPLRKILYVEDEPDIQLIAKLSLESVGGFEVECCTSGSEALERLRVARPDLVLLDVMMPGMDGPETLRRIRASTEFSSVPVIFITAKVRHNEVEEFKSLGALGVIPKPFSPMDLSSDIRKIWSEANG